jgi:CheY-like chemotaxis protein
MSSSAPARCTVLVVDDDDEIRVALAEVLEDEGYRVELAENGRDALALIDPERPPRVIILDMMMPVMDGWSVLAALRADANLANIPVVVVTAAGRRVGNLPVAHVLPKPVILDRLLSAVAECAA